MDHPAFHVLHSDWHRRMVRRSCIGRYETDCLEAVFRRGQWALAEETTCQIRGQWREAVLG
jgi:hypothetical protein